MKEQIIHVPRWVSRCISPAVNWAVSGPYPQGVLKPPTLRLAAFAVAGLVRSGVIWTGGMGGNPPCKRSEADPALSSEHTASASRGCNPSPTVNDTSCLDKQIGVNQ